MKRNLPVAVFLVSFVAGIAAASGCEDTRALPYDHPWVLAADDLADDWAHEPALPSIDGDQCMRWIRELRVVHAPSAQAFIDWTGLYPWMGDECYQGRDSCATGSYLILGGQRRSYPEIILSPGENVDGHRITARVEMAHVLALCSGHPDARSYSDPLLWSGTGLVWN